MKRKITSFLFLGVAILSYGQSGNLKSFIVNKRSSASTYQKCVGFHVTKPLKELGTTANISPTEILPGEQIGYPLLNITTHWASDTVVQQQQGFIPLDAPIVNFEGGNYHDRPDATGAAGPNNYIQGVNPCNFNIYDKTGNLILATDMSLLGGTCYDDPIVMYDKFADRWIVSNVSENSLDLTVAVSTSPDPAGSYYVYSFAFPVMPDFPKYSIWTDGYYVTYRDINTDTVGVAVLERNRMLNGDPNAGIIHSKFPNSKKVNQHTELPASPRILTCDGALPPYGTPAYLMYNTNLNCGDPSNSIMIYRLNTDTTNKTCTITFVDSLATAPYNASFAGSMLPISEPEYAVWALNGPFQYRAPYIKFTGYSSVALCNTINLGNSIAGIRWYELRQNDTSQKWNIHQQGTYGPADSVNRWNGSICMDLNGDISLAYNVCNATNLYPGIRYTGRLASDPLGTMPFAEQTAVKGTHSIGIQWGDYSESWLDPDGLTFWHTNQYSISPTGDTANTRIFSFRLANSLGTLVISANKTAIHAYQSNNILNISATGLASNEKVVVNLFDINGRQLSSQWVTPKDNKFSAQINVAGIAVGTYLVRIGNANFQKVEKVIIQ
jgi:hypothetical protein